MVYYSNPYKRIIRAFIRAIKVFFSLLISKSVLITIICFLVLLLFINENRVEAYTYSEDVLAEVTMSQEKNQDDFILTIIPEYVNNTLAWQQLIQPIFDSIIDNKYNIYVTSKSKNGDEVSQIVYPYLVKDGDSNMSYVEYSFYNSFNTGGPHILTGYKITGLSSRTIYYTTVTHEVSRVVTTYPATATFPVFLGGYKSQLYKDFLAYYEGFGKLTSGGSGQDYSIILNSISTYLSNIDTSNSDISNQLSSVLQILNTIAQKNPTDYTQQISGITSQMSDLIDTQQEVADNTAEMIQQQEEIKEGIDDLNEFLSDDTTDSTTITDNMPTNDDFQDVTESGFDNIFTTLRNAFTSDNYQDVEFIVPFSNGQKITLPSNLTENIIPTAIKTLIQMVYWYFISRFIVKDIAGYIEKAKSGDVFNSSDTNIKTDML